MSTSSNKLPFCKQEDDFYVWKKGEVHSLSPHFNTSEFACSCKNKECVNQRISVSLIQRLSAIRRALKVPLVVTSGYRCQAHQNFLVRNKVSKHVAPNSNHVAGEAADVKAEGLLSKDWIETAKLYFTSIGIGRTFLHVDIRTRTARWNY